MLKITGLSRIHITLFDLEGRHGRIDGGMGVALKEPKIVVTSGNCQKVKLGDYPPEGICVKENYEEHVGLGHTTQYLLAIAKLVSESNFEKRSALELARVVKRGGTSGVGVHLFEQGGFVVDGGHSIKVKSLPLPSDYSTAPPPPLILRGNFPWYIYLNIPSGKRIFGQSELEAFKNEVSGLDELARVVLMEFIPSVIEKDLSGALDGLWKIQGLGFKKIEVQLQSNLVKETMMSLYKTGFPSGLSSFGPTIFTFVSSRREGEELVSRFGGWVSEPNNRGAQVEWN